MPDLEWEEMMKRYYTYNGFQLFDYRIFHDDLVIGSFSFSFYKESSNFYEGNEKVVKFGIELLRNYRKRGLEKKALKLMLDDCVNHHKTIFLTERQDAYMKHFFETIGAQIVQTEIKNRLDLDKVDYQMVQGWIKEGKMINPDTRVITTEDNIPAELESEYAKAFNDAIQQIPHDDIDMKRKEFTVVDLREMEKIDDASHVKSINVFTLEKTGEVSGITIIKVLPGSDVSVYQGITGVPLAYRGRKLGKWIKAKMVLYLKEKYPLCKSIITGNSKTNEPMLYINNHLGFKRYNEVNSFQITLDELKLSLVPEILELNEMIL